MGVLLWLSMSCAHPSLEERERADYGPYPIKYQETILSVLQLVLKDPDSAKVEFLRGPSPLWLRVFTQGQYGYGVCASVNAKNSFGGYTGRQLYVFLLRDNQVVRIIGGRELQDMAARACEQIA
jgi:hypothetical protein